MLVQRRRGMRRESRLRLLMACNIRVLSGATHRAVAVLGLEHSHVGGMPQRQLHRQADR